MNITRSKQIKCVQYFLIYILISYVGGSLQNIFGGPEFFSPFVLACSLLMFVVYRNIRATKRFWIFLVIFAVELLAVVTITGGDLSLGTCFNLLTILILVFVAIDIDKSNFLDRFLFLVYILSVISIIQFALVMIFGFNTFAPIYTHFYSDGNSFGGLITRFSLLHPKRNCGIFGEPGQYQALLTADLYFILFRADSYNYKKNRNKYLIICMLTIITCQSTTGFLGMAGILVIYLLCGSGEDNKANRKVRAIVAIIIIALIIWLFFILDKNSFLYYNFVGKFWSENGINFNQNSGSARVNSITQVLELIKTKPKFIFGAGYEAMYTYNLDGCASLPMLMLAIGAPAFVTLYGYLLYKGICYRKHWADVVARVFLIINTGLSQPNILFSTFVLMMIYDYVVNGVQRIKNEF